VSTHSVHQSWAA